MTDGHWLWHSDLAHYVQRYHVVLDPEFIKHVRSNGWTVPDLSDSDVDAMVAVLLEAE
ncbi:hypothetical protein [Kitasatospora sp. KL5]|uniref:hypothetical protein n=1 Tax=Kitasatospora sp. KL5 TaxID=3425125 RepID=UPI003D6DC0BB